MKRVHLYTRTHEKYIDNNNNDQPSPATNKAMEHIFLYISNMKWVAAVPLDEPDVNGDGERYNKRQHDRHALW